MGLIKSILFPLVLTAAVFSQAAMGAEITGTVFAAPPASGVSALGIKSIGPAAGITVKAEAQNGTVIAEGKTSGSGVYTLTVPSDRLDSVLLIRAETSAGELRAMRYSGTVDVDPVTEILAWRLLAPGMSPQNVTADEMALMRDRLAALSAAVDFSGAASAANLTTLVLDQPDVNLELGSLTTTFSMPGDNRAAVEAVKSAITDFLKGFTSNDNDLLRSRLAANATAQFGQETASNLDQILQKINALHTQFKDIRMDTDFLDIQIQGSSATVAAREHLRMTAPAAQASVDETWIAVSKLELRDAKWLLASRAVPKCRIPKAAMEPDGRLADWVGIQPCYYRTPDAGAPDKDSITALFLARDDTFLYWRMDLNMKIHNPVSSVPIQGIPRGSYYLTMRSQTSSENCDSFFVFVTNEVTSAASRGRACTKGPDGKNVETFYTYDGFAVGNKSIEGRVPLEDFAFLSQGLYIFGNANRKAKPGMPAEPDFLTGVVEIDTP